MRYGIALLLMTMPLPAFAGTCDRWTAAMQEDEGGPVMTANICAPTGKAAPELSVTCGTPGTLSIRFIPVAPAGYPPDEPEFKTDIEFSLDQEMFTRTAHYEEMDGALVLETDIESPFVYVLKVQKEVMLSDVNDKFPSATFTLRGAKKALDKIIATCPKQ